MHKLLQANTAYFVLLEAFNRAGSATTQRSASILLEETVGAPGAVRAGPSFAAEGTFFFADDDNLTCEQLASVRQRE